MEKKMVSTILSPYQRKEIYEIQAYKHRCSAHNCRLLFPSGLSLHLLSGPHTRKQIHPRSWQQMTCFSKWLMGLSHILKESLWNKIECVCRLYARRAWGQLTYWNSSKAASFSLSRSAMDGSQITGYINIFIRCFPVHHHDRNHIWEDPFWLIVLGVQPLALWFYASEYVVRTVRVWTKVYSPQSRQKSEKKVNEGARTQPQQSNFFNYIILPNPRFSRISPNSPRTGSQLF